MSDPLLHEQAIERFFFELMPTKLLPVATEKQSAARDFFEGLVPFQVSGTLAYFKPLQPDAKEKASDNIAPTHLTNNHTRPLRVEVVTGVVSPYSRRILLRGLECDTLELRLDKQGLAGFVRGRDGKWREHLKAVHRKASGELSIVEAKESMLKAKVVKEILRFQLRLQKEAKAIRNRSYETKAGKPESTAATHPIAINNTKNSDVDSVLPDALVLALSDTIDASAAAVSYQPFDAKLISILALHESTEHQVSCKQIQQFENIIRRAGFEFAASEELSQCPSCEATKMLDVATLPHKITPPYEISNHLLEEYQNLFIGSFPAHYFGELPFPKEDKDKRQPKTTLSVSNIMTISELKEILCNDFKSEYFSQYDKEFKKLHESARKSRSHTGFNLWGHCDIEIHLVPEGTVSSEPLSPTTTIGSLECLKTWPLVQVTSKRPDEFDSHGKPVMQSVHRTGRAGHNYVCNPEHPTHRRNSSFSEFNGSKLKAPPLFIPLNVYLQNYPIQSRFLELRVIEDARQGRKPRERKPRRRTKQYERRKMRGKK